MSTVYNFLARLQPGICMPNAETINHPWSIDLPIRFKGEVVTPLAFEIQRDCAVAAARVMGRDKNDTPCYCAYSYAITELCYDDGDMFGEAVVFAEELSGWRLRNGRWLVRRMLTIRDDSASSKEVYSFAETMPR